MGHWQDGCHYGIAITEPHGAHVLACYRRDERDRLLRRVQRHQGDNSS